MKQKNEKPLVLAASSEQDQIDRKMLVWINEFPDKPVYIINYENLSADDVGMALSTIQGTYITRRFITGGYEAEYQFKLIYRIKPGNSNDKRLSADELLNQFGDWALTQVPDVGEGLRVIRIEPTSRASVFAAYENGDEDHQILMKMTYERV